MGNYTFGVGVEPHKRWPVAWYNPFVLLQSARELLSSTDVIRNADPRELWAGTFQPSDHAAEVQTDGSFWFDFVSDTGDGGNASYTVARAVQAEALHLSHSPIPEHLSFPRGRVLYFGGDLCYPSANVQEYQYRFLELFEGARSTLGHDPQGRSAYAIPQNHDWFDSISTFKRYFVNRNNGEVFGLNTPQKRSYFATRLPQRWWVWGLDFALAGDIDRGQYEAFRRLAGDKIGSDDNPSLRIESGDQLVLIYPEPYWTRPLGDSAPEGYPKRYQRLEAMLEAKGIHIRMRLAGDVHHYCRESSEPLDAVKDDVLVTCGSGGAFLHPTHAQEFGQTKARCYASHPDAISDELRTATRIGTVSGAETAGSIYTGQCTYPDPAQSRSLSEGNVWALFKFAWNSHSPRGGKLIPGILQGNVLSVVLIGLIYSLALVSNHAQAPLTGGWSWQQAQLDWFRSIWKSPLCLTAHGLLLLMCLSLSAGEPGPKVKKWGLPALHFLAHVVAISVVFALVACVRNWVGPGSAGWATLATAFLTGLLYPLVGSVLGGLVTGCYLALMARAGLMWNSAFSPLACEDFKGFLRFRIDAGGSLTGYFFGCDHVPKKWQRSPAPRGAAAGDARPAWEEAPQAGQAQWRLVDRFTLAPRQQS